MKGSEKIDGFFSDKVVDLVVVEFAEAVDDFGMYAGFLVNFAQSSLLFGFAVFDVSLRKTDVAGYVGDENVFPNALILGIQHCAAAFFVITDEFGGVLRNKAFGQTGDVRFVINAVFARGDENIVFFSGFVVRKGNDLGVEFVDRKIFTDEDNFLYAVLAERRVAEIEKTGEAAVQKSAIGFFYVYRAGKAEYLSCIVFRRKIVEIGHGFISCIAERVRKGKSTPFIMTIIAHFPSAVNSECALFEILLQDMV